MTLIEVMIAIAILSLVTTAIYSVLSTSSSSYVTTNRLQNLQEQARRVVDELAKELRLADQAGVVITTVNGSNQIVFNSCTGFVGGVAQWGTPITWNCLPSAVDANENGVVDEGRIVRTQDAVAFTHCNFVKAGGFTLTRTGREIVIRLTLISTDAKHRVIETFVESSVTMRNSST